jgi:ABC-type nitrate/sulfonate/bicarbonate transport system substrate-binding protein
MVAIGSYQSDEGRQGQYRTAAADGCRQHARRQHGACVGEPWNHRAIIDGVGPRSPPRHLESTTLKKSAGTTAEFVKKTRITSALVTAAILEASKWIDAGLGNKNKMAETIADVTSTPAWTRLISVFWAATRTWQKTWDELLI